MNKNNMAGEDALPGMAKGDDTMSDTAITAPATNGEEIGISIIVPVYNVGRYLRQCLDSLECQAFGNFEAVCVDDGSTDDSAAILGEYAAKDSRIKVRLRPLRNGVSSSIPTIGWTRIPCPGSQRY